MRREDERDAAHDERHGRVQPAAAHALARARRAIAATDCGGSGGGDRGRRGVRVDAGTSGSQNMMPQYGTLVSAHTSPKYHVRPRRRNRRRRPSSRRHGRLGARL